jgi:mRNA interferase MazF
VGEPLSDDTGVNRKDDAATGRAGAGSWAQAMVNRGEVWWYEPPESKRRPALVMTRQEAIESLNEVFVVLATTTIRGIPTEVELGPEDGMPRNCVVNADHAKTVEKVFFSKRITTLSPAKMARVCNALALAHGC